MRAIRRLYYLTANRIPGFRAASIQQVRMCEGFQRAGMDVELVHPRYRDPFVVSASLSLWDYYGIKTRFRRRELPTLMMDQPSLFWYGRIPKIGGLTLCTAFSFYWLRNCLVGREVLDHSVVYAREMLMVYLAQLLQRWLGIDVPIFYEAHRLDFGASAWLYERVLPKLRGIVAITQAAKNGLVDAYHLCPEHVLVEPDGVDLERFSVCNLSVDSIRASLGLPLSPVKLIGFAGNLYPGRGGEEMLYAASELAPDVCFVLVGGQPEDLQRLQVIRSELGLEARVHFVGHIPPADVPKYLKAFDVLVAPYTLSIPTASWTSPLKIFEYMAARKPIVISRLPVFGEVLRDGENCLMVRPGDSDDLAVGLRRVLRDETLGRRLAERAYADVQRFTWSARAERIVTFIHARCHAHSPERQHS